MTSAASIAFAGVAPVGLGIYARGGRHVPGPWRYYVAPPASARAGDWVFLGIEAMRPESWRGSLALALATAARVGARGVVVNPENGWADLSGPARRAELAALGAALTSASLDTRVGVVTHGGFDIGALAPHCGRGVWFSVELFYDPPTNARTWARFLAVCGHRLVPTIATGFGLAGSDEEDATGATPDAYARYLASVPVAGGAILWGGVSEVGRPHEIEALRSRYAALPAAALMLPGAAINALDTWQGIAACLVLVGLTFAAILIRYRG